MPKHHRFLSPVPATTSPRTKAEGGTTRDWSGRRRERPAQTVRGSGKPPCFTETRQDSEPRTRHDHPQARTPKSASLLLLPTSPQTPSSVLAAEVSPLQGVLTLRSFPLQQNRPASGPTPPASASLCCSAVEGAYPTCLSPGLHSPSLRWRPPTSPDPHSPPRPASRPPDRACLLEPHGATKRTLTSQSPASLSDTVSCHHGPIRSAAGQSWVLSVTECDPCHAQAPREGATACRPAPG